MKILKLLSVGALLFGFGLLTSCKKDWTCACTGQYLGQPYNAKNTVKDAKKSDAKEQCQATGETLKNLSQVDQSLGYPAGNITCKLD